MKLRGARFPGLVLSLALLGAATSRAQITFQPDMGAFSAQMGGQLLEIQRDSLHRSDPGRRGGRAVAPAGVVTSYRADPRVTTRVQRQFVDFVRSKSGAAGGSAMAQAFASQDLLQNWAKQAAPDGMRLGDAADAMAEYWVTNWLMAHRKMNASPAQVRGVREQVRRALAADPAFRRLGDAGRQELAEVMIYNTLLQGSVYGNAARRHDDALLQKISDAAVARFRNEAHVDLRAVDLTDRGLVVAG